MQNVYDFQESEIKLPTSLFDKWFKNSFSNPTGNKRELCLPIVPIFKFSFLNISEESLS